jgi:D-alanyl-D-alanine carboxypeptidase/D-alanyl-D-alanine-endopeptidase (penicillin-binding protein 4)
MKSPGFEAGHWGMIVVDRKTGETVFEKNADQLFAPASVTKLFSTSAALAALGPDHRFQTPLVRRGEIDDKGVLQGDLVLLASGDLALGGRTSPDDGTLLFKDHDHTYAGGDNLAELVPVDPLAGLDHLARGAKDAGIRAITGDVIVDDRLFDPAPSTGSGPSRVSPIVVNDNVVDVLVAPAPQAGQPAVVRTVPASAFLAMDARVETVGQGEKAEIQVESIGPRRFTVRGKIPLGHKEVVRIHEIDEPAAFARALLLERLAARGVVVNGSPLGQNRIDRLPPREQVAQWPKVAQYTSPPLKEYVRVILKVSHNLHASSLPLLVAIGQGGRTLADGLKKQGEFLKGLGIPTGAISFGGGAGGSRSDLATPRATVALLRAIDSRPEAAIFEAALPIVGRDGTAAEHIAADSPARGHIRAKTGTYWVDNGLHDGTVLTSKALAGYMETASGRPLAFALFLNNVPADGEKVSSSAAGKLLGAICEAVYLSDAGAKPAAAAPEPPTPTPAAAAPAAAAAAP